MNEEIEHLISAMRGESGWLLSLFAWSAALRYALKPVTQFFEGYIKQVGEQEGKWAVKVLSSPAYRFVSFLLDYLASVKLPARPKPAQGDTQIIVKAQ